MTIVMVLDDGDGDDDGGDGGDGGDDDLYESTDVCCTVVSVDAAASVPVHGRAVVRRRVPHGHTRRARRGQAPSAQYAHNLRHHPFIIIFLLLFTSRCPVCGGACAFSCLRANRTAGRELVVRL
jgi:hypothetical protein